MLVAGGPRGAQCAGIPAGIRAHASAVLRRPRPGSHSGRRVRRNPAPVLGFRLESRSGRRTHARAVWLGKPVLYRLSYVRAAWILAAPVSTSHGGRLLDATSAVPERGIDACPQVARQRVEVLVVATASGASSSPVEVCSNVSQPGSEPLDLVLELFVGVDAMEQQPRVLRVGSIRIDDDRRARQRSEQSHPGAGPVLVPGPRRCVRTQFSVPRKGLVHAHWETSRSRFAPRACHTPADGGQQSPPS